MRKYIEKGIHTAISGGLSAGEFTTTFDSEGNEILAVCICKADRKGGLASFTVTVNEKEVIEDHLLIEPGFYPVKSGGMTRLAFIDAYGRARFVPSAYAKEIRLSGGLIDLDEVKYRKEVLKHLEHLEKEVRKLKKEPKPKEKAPTIDEEVERLLGKRGLKYVPPKDDDDRLY